MDMLNVKKTVRCCAIAVAILLAAQTNAQNRKVDFVAQLSFGHVGYLSPSNLSVINPSQSDINSLGIDLKAGVRFKCDLTVKAGFSTLGGTEFYYNDRTRESAGTYYANLELGKDFRIKSWIVSPAIGVGFIGYTSNVIADKLENDFTGTGFGANTELSIAYCLNEHFAIKASVGAIYGSITNLKTSRNNEISREALDTFNHFGNYSIFVGKCMLGMEFCL